MLGYIFKVIRFLVTFVMIYVYFQFERDLESPQRHISSMSVEYFLDEIN